MTFTLTLDKAPSKDLVISYAVDSSSTAKLADDFTVSAGTVIFAAGQTSAQVQVTVLADDIDEANGTIVLNFTNTDVIQGASSTTKVVNNLKATGTIVDDDASFVFTSAAANSVAENTTAVVTVAGADADSATGLTTTLSGADAALFSLTNGALAFKTAPNFEAPADAGANNVYNVSVNVADGSGNVGTQNLVITVTNVNEAPVVTSAATGTVAENAAISTAVYTATASDVDAGDVMSYSLAGTDAAAFAINAATGVVTLKASANYEAKSSYAIDVTATDAGGLSNTKAVTVAVTNVNEAPVVSSAATGTVAENAATSTVVYTATSTDVDAADSATYSLGGADAAAFNINATTGAVTLKASADFETKAAYAIDVTATDAGGLTNTKAVAVSVTNVNEAPVVTSAATATVAENAATSTVVYTATSSDVDAADSATYSLGGADAAAFAINATTGAVTLQASADRETKASYAIDVTATDAGGLTNTKSVAVAVSNVNEAPTGVADSIAAIDNTAVTFNVLTNDVKVDASNTISVGSYTQPSNGTLVSNGNGSFTYTPSATFLSGVDSFTYTPVEAGGESGVATTVTIQVNTVNSAPVVTAGQTFGVTENTNTAGQSVGFVLATDEEGGMPQNWAITAGNAAGNFAINAFTGEITTTNTANFNHEATDSYALSVTAKDGSGLVSAAQTVTINVTDVNEAPVMTSAATATVAENAATSTVVYTATSTDVDDGDSATYSLDGADAAAFSIDATTGEVTLNASADFEAQPSYSIDVTVTDASGLTSTQAVAVTVTNVNEAPVVTSAATATVAENAAIATVIYTATATDVDAGDTLAYSLTGTDAAAFAIDATTGVVTLNASADFEAQDSYDINVVATDADGSTSTQAVAVTVTNVNEAPVVTSAATATVAENVAITTVVYTATATDVDAGDTHTFSLTGTDAAAFAIDAITGVVTLNAPADFEAQASYAINVVATDAGGLTSTQAVAVAVTDDGGGQTYVLTTNVDSGADFTGTDNDDIFYANNAAEFSTTDIVDSGNTLTSLDVIDGGLGSDTLNINDFTIGAGVGIAGLNTPTLVGLSVTNIETVNVTSVDATIINTTAWTGVTEVNSTLSTASTVTAAGTTDVNITTTGVATVSGGNDITIVATSALVGTTPQTIATGNIDITVSGAITVGSTGNGGGATSANIDVTSTLLTAAAIQVFGGEDVTVTAGGVAAGTITVGSANANAAGNVEIDATGALNSAIGVITVVGGVNTDAVNITANATLLDGAAPTTAGTGAINVTGGTSVNVELSGVVAGGSDDPLDALTFGTVGITGLASTGSVSVTQTAAIARAANTLGNLDGTAAIVNGAVTITDFVAAAAATADTITSVEITNAGTIGITSSALTSLSLSGTTGATTIGGQSTTEATTLALNLEGGASAGVTATTLTTGYTTVNVVSTGANTVGGLSVAEATAVNISGTGSATLGTVTTAAAGVITSTNTGGVSLSTMATGQLFVGTASSGADTITLFAGTTTVNSTGAGNDTVILSSLGVAGSVDAGDGDADVLSLTAADAVTLSANATFEAQISNFERLSVAVGGANNSINLANLDDINHVTIAGAVGNLDIAGFSSGGTFAQTALIGGGSSYTGAFTGAADSFNLSASGADGYVNAGTMTLADVETVNITLADTDAQANTAVFNLKLDAIAADTVTVTGSAGITFANSSLTSVSTLNASGVTATGQFGGVTFVGNNIVSTITGGAGDDALTGGTQDDTISGGAGDDVLVGLAGNDVITGGEGADVITGGLGADVLTGGAGIDTFAFGTDGSVQGTSLDSITDFTATTIGLANAGDLLTFGGATTVLAADTTALVAGTNVQTDAGGLVTFDAADNTLALKIVAIQADTELDAVGSVAMFVDSGNTYVYYAGAAIGNTDDQIIELTGISNLTTITGGATTSIA